MNLRSQGSAAHELRRRVSEALALIERESGAGRASAATPAAGALLDQCRSAVARAEARRSEPVRLIHHMACTGGTLISKFISTLPNTVLISEVDPLSHLHLRGEKKPFFPTDLIADLRFSPRGISRDVDIAVFQSAVSTLRKELEREGRRLVLRDHSHSRYHATPDPAARPGLRDIVSAHLDSLSVVTVRHPLDSYLSLQKNKWVHYEPGTLDEYCRRYRLFLDDHAGLPMYKYEDFTEGPDSVLKRISADLELGWTEGAEDLHKVFQISGDSGRRSFRVGPRVRRPVPDAVAEEAGRSEHYDRLCSALEYPTGDPSVPED